MTTTTQDIKAVRRYLLDRIAGTEPGDDPGNDREAVAAWWRTGIPPHVPGAVFDRDELSIDEYHGGPGVSSSGLSEVRDCVARYLGYIADVDVVTPAKIIGAAINDAILQPERWETSYLRIKPFARLDPAVKKDVAAQIAPAHGMYLRQTDLATGSGNIYVADSDGGLESPAELRSRRGTVALDASLYDQVVELRDAVMLHPVLGKILSHAGTEYETSYYATDPATGLLVRARVDIRPTTGWLVDLKTAYSANEDAFRSSVFRFGYHRQAAQYLDTVTWATGEQPEGFVWIVADKRFRAPECIALRAPEPRFVDYGRHEYRKALDVLAEWVEIAEERGLAKAWSGYPLEFMEVNYRREAFDG